MKLSQFKENYIFTTMLYLSDDKKDYIKMREPTFAEYQKFSTADNKSQYDIIKKLFPDCIIEHTVEDEDGNLLQNAELAKEVFNSGSTGVSLLTQWMESIPFHSEKMKQEK